MKKLLIIIMTLGLLIIMQSCLGEEINNGLFLVNDLHCLVDLHLHLDGAISVQSAKELAKAQGIEIPARIRKIRSEMRVPFGNSDLSGFLEKFDFSNSLLQTAKGIRMAVTNLLNELKNQGVMYAEIRFAPQKSMEKGLTQDEATAAAIEGLHAADGIDANLILCCMRGDDNREQNLETVRIAEKYLGKGVVAVDLAGDEARYPTRDFEDIFALADKKGIPITIHAGEADGPDSIRDAIEIGADRIGHGVRSLEDEELVRELVEKQIPLELCPTSNIATGVFDRLTDWPLNALLDSGMYMTINTDDPSVEGTTIKTEYNRLIRRFGIGKKEVKLFLQNSVNASFADDALKQKLLKKIDAEIPD